MAQSLNEYICPPTQVIPRKEDPKRPKARPNLDFRYTSEQSEMDAEGVQTILRIVPDNIEARKAFNTVAQCLEKGTLNPLHAHYLCIIGTCSLGYELEDVRRSGGETSDEDVQPTMGLEGYYRLAFGLPSITKGPKWVIGRGSGKKFGPERNVDILLVAPDKRGISSLAAFHLYLGIHPISGVWRITAGANLKVEDEYYSKDAEIFLYKPSTRIEILDMQYLICFDITTPEGESEYIRQRNKVFEGEKIDLPRTNLSGIPSTADKFLNSIVFRTGLASGSFGCVFEGFNPVDGRLRVAKRLTVKKAHQVPEVEREIYALQRFKNRTGIIELIEWRTSLNGKDLRDAQYPLDVFLIHEKGVAFDRFDWDTISWDLKRLLCSQLLKGLEAIHEAGCMHRDITPKNLLLFPYEAPPRAKICDFGKFCMTPTDVETTLAGWPYLPPELQESREYEYDQTLDIWMLGLSLTHSWWTETENLWPRKENEWRSIQVILFDDKNGTALGEIVAGMMAWYPHGRPSAVDALKHKTFQEYPPMTAQDTISSAKRSFDTSDR
ncbi:MAG: hypothetical protein Q9182_007537 [Xanthomendoza sp. 2 TL-2023]